MDTAQEIIMRDFSRVLEKKRMPNALYPFIKAARNSLLFHTIATPPWGMFVTFRHKLR